MVTAADSENGQSVEADGAVVLGALREQPLSFLRVRRFRHLAAAAVGMSTSLTSVTSAASTLALIFAHVFRQAGCTLCKSSSLG